MDLFPDQQHALDLAARSRLFILTGAAGTGKSTAVRAILDALSLPTERFFLAAPSGKAAKRLSEVSGRPAVTIHRLLKPIREGKHFVFTRGPDNRIPADLIVLDEVSMVDVSLMARFLEAVAQGTRLIFVGDPYQLPSVGPGNVLRDFLASGVIPAAELTIIKRQDEGLLIRNCHRIKSGEDIHVDNAKTGDFYFLEQDTEEAIQAKIIELMTKSLPASRGFDPMHDIQVISPFRERTILSCKAVNEKLQQALNTNPPLNNCRFRIGDKVIQQKNDYESDIVNGDIGYVQRIDQALRQIEVRFENPDRLVKLDLFHNHLELAYCLTIHKSQGSEWPAVIIPIHSTFGSLMLHRNLLYTAVSRAKKLCVIVGQREEIPKIVARAGQEKRYTGLTGLLSRRDETS